MKINLHLLDRSIDQSWIRINLEIEKNVQFSWKYLKYFPYLLPLLPLLKTCFDGCQPHFRQEIYNKMPHEWKFKAYIYEMMNELYLHAQAEVYIQRKINISLKNESQR